MATAYARGILAPPDGVGKGRFPSGGFISGPLAASWGLSALFSLLSSLCSLLSLLSSLFSRCRSFLRSHFPPASSIFASGHRRRPQLLRPFAAPSLARRNARSDEIINLMGALEGPLGDLLRPLIIKKLLNKKLDSRTPRFLNES